VDLGWTTDNLEEEMQTIGATDNVQQGRMKVSLQGREEPQTMQDKSIIPRDYFESNLGDPKKAEVKIVEGLEDIETEKENENLGDDGEKEAVDTDFTSDYPELEESQNEDTGGVSAMEVSYDQNEVASSREAVPWPGFDDSDDEEDLPEGKHGAFAIVTVVLMEERRGLE
jgi:hypothetical protein